MGHADVEPFRGNADPLRYARAWSAVRERLRQVEYDLVHAQFGQSGVTSTTLSPGSIVRPAVNAAFKAST